MYGDYYDEENDVNYSYSYHEYHFIPINLTDIDFVGYTALWGRLGLNYEIHFMLNETVKSTYRYVLNVEDGKKLRWECDSEKFSGGSHKEFFNNLI